MTRRHPLALALLLAGVTLAAAAGAASSPATPQVTPEQRAAEQDAAIRDYLGRDMIFVSSPQIEAYLKSIAERLLATRENPPPMPRFLVQSTDEFTVFTDAHGNIVVGTEVLRVIESEDELAAALSHELGHVIAGHAQNKNVMQKLPGTVETTQIIAVAVDNRRNGDKVAAGQASGFSADSLATTQSAAAVWTDFVAPSWNRKQESEADLMGVDMVRAANYDPAAFSTLFGRIDAAHAVRSARVEALRQKALARAKEKAPAADAGTKDQLVGGLTSGLETAAVDAVFQGLAGWGTDYDSPENRTAAVLEYVQKTSTGRRDKVPRSQRFVTEIRAGEVQRLLDADKAALQVMAALNSPSKDGAKAPADQLLADGASLPAPHLNLAVGTWLETSGKPADAEQRAIAWEGAPLAPRTAYLWRAHYQGQRQDHAGAMATLEQGATQLGSRDLFLPQMVAEAKAGGDLPRADELAMECSRSGAGFNLQTAAKLLDTGPAKPTGVYAECVAALGYDPVERRDQALGTQPAAGQSKVEALGKSLSDKLKKVLGK